jgi:S-adenosyl-L-methionine hydrolase (adenosine-forming)
MAIITLLTDFGTQDEYVGVLKGVISTINPTVTIIDVTHGIAPQNVVTAAYTLKAAYPFFPLGTIHLAVVDPGVGTRRDIVAVRCGGHLFLAPDNGLLAPILAEHSPEAGYRVENENLFRHPVSRTFHGRDVFAPVAAHLSQGLPMKALGRPLDFDQLRLLHVREPWISIPGNLEGEVVSVDRFGNLITNIGSRHLAGLGPGKIDILLGEHTISGMVDSYAQGVPGELLAIIGGRDCLEIAVNGASAFKFLNLAHGGIVRVKAREK